MIARGTIAVALLLLLGAAPLIAQDGERALPTLESLGVGPWSNASGSIQFGLSGRLDLEGYLPGEDPTYLIDTTDPFFAPRLRLFADLFAGEKTYVTAELRIDHGPMESWDGYDIRLEQAFLRYTLAEPFAVQLGRFASPFGSYPSRHHTDGDWFIRPPLMYEYRTTVLTDQIPADADTWVSWKDDPALRRRGAPPVWGAPYQFGAMAFGALRNVTWRAAFMSSAVASGPAQWNRTDLDNGNIVAAIGYRFAPWVRAELSYSAGPFMQETLVDENPTAHGIGWFEQTIFGGELLFELAHTQVRAEAFHDTWAYVEEDAIDIDWSVEGRQELFQDWFVAGRVGQMRFSDIETSAGSEPWDYNVQREQVAAGYRFASNAEIRAEYLAQQTDGPVDPDDDLISVQLWWAF